ncbi:MAG: DUF2161 domain-containing phosphodiesterase [Bacillota bacterium]
MAARRESDLYTPIKEFLQQQGYTVRGEVNGCDLVGVRGEDLVIVELKVAFNLALLLQGVQRQAVTDAVYLAVEAPRKTRSGPRWSEIRGLCRRLGLGLIFIHFTGKAPTVEVLCDPEPYIPRKQPKMRGRLLKEFQRRSGDHNTGGTSRRPVVTAYREEALRTAAYLAEHGPSQPRTIRKETGAERSATILQDNVYGWFERIERGVYQITPKGKQALAQYADVVAAARQPET